MTFFHGRARRFPVDSGREGSDWGDLVNAYSAFPFTIEVEEEGKEKQVFEVKQAMWHGMYEEAVQVDHAARVLVNGLELKDRL